MLGDAKPQTDTRRRGWSRWRWKLDYLFTNVQKRLRDVQVSRPYGRQSLVSWAEFKVEHESHRVLQE